MTELLPMRYSTDQATIERVAAGLRGLPPDIPKFATAEDRARLRAEFDGVVDRLRAADIEVVGRVA